MKRLFKNRIITSNKYLSYLLLFLFILIIRFPFFFTDEFNWDESTYIIIGQWIVDGNLPYLEKTAIKPPLLYYLYSLFVYFSFNELYLPTSPLLSIVVVVIVVQVGFEHIPSFRLPLGLS